MNIEGYQSYEKAKLTQKENERMATEKELEKQLEQTETGQALLQFEKSLDDIRKKRIQRQKDAMGGIQDSIARLGEIEQIWATRESFQNFVNEMSQEERKKFQSKISEIEGLMKGRL